jgi:hypothetical protein
MVTEAHPVGRQVPHTSSDISTAISDAPGRIHRPTINGYALLRGGAPASQGGSSSGEKLLALGEDELGDVGR